MASAHFRSQRRGMVTELITTDAEFYDNYLCDENKLEHQVDDDDDDATAADDDNNHLKEPPEKKAKADADADDAAAKSPPRFQCSGCCTLCEELK